jgi:hypothetical protein
MDYNIKSTKIFYENQNGEIAICSPSGELPVEVVAIRDLPNGTPYWIIDFETEENLLESIPSMDFFYAYELDTNLLGPPHGIALGYDEWVKLQPPGTPGI